MNWMQAAVEHFHRVIGSTIGETPAIRDADMRAALILEEAIETVEAIVGGQKTASMLQGAWSDYYEKHKYDGFFIRPDLVKAVDGICDTIFVALGAAVTFGVDINPYFKAVAAANMTKGNGPVRADGKRLKPPEFVPPEATIRALLIKAGWTPPDEEA